MDGESSKLTEEDDAVGADMKVGWLWRLYNLVRRPHVRCIQLLWASEDSV